MSDSLFANQSAQEQSASQKTSAPLSRSLSFLDFSAFLDLSDETHPASSVREEPPIQKPCPYLYDQCAPLPFQSDSTHTDLPQKMMTPSQYKRPFIPSVPRVPPFPRGKMHGRFSKPSQRLKDAKERDSLTSTLKTLIDDHSIDPIMPSLKRAAEHDRKSYQRVEQLIRLIEENPTCEQLQQFESEYAQSLQDVEEQLQQINAALKTMPAPHIAAGPDERYLDCILSKDKLECQKRECSNNLENVRKVPAQIQISKSSQAAKTFFEKEYHRLQMDAKRKNAALDAIKRVRNNATISQDSLQAFQYFFQEFKKSQKK